MTSFVTRPAWDSLPAPVREGIERRLPSQVLAAQPVTGGFTPGAAFRVELADGGGVFVKGIAGDHPLVGMYAAEARVCEALPANAPAPRLLWNAEIEGWRVLAFERVTGSHPDLSPKSAHVPALRRALEALGELRCPEILVPQRITFDGWRETYAWPEHTKELLEWEERCDISGDALVHADLRADNMLLQDSGEIAVVDWAAAMRAAPWMDSAFVVPQLISAGYDPAGAEEAVAGTPGWDEAPPEAITAFAVGLCGIWERGWRSAGGALAAYREHAASAGRAWISYRLGW